ncbi:MAG: DUF72 domain-containing protein [Anaerolineales bacterium]|jgi:uncharacterized protein YecE (DUF72 family)
MILLGTSGFSYDDWIGPVYPPDLPRRQWLEHMASQVDTIELNVTYYRVPGAKTVAGWAARTPDDFLFSLKAHRTLTHEREQPDFGAFRESLAPLVDSGKLACVLVQFPYSFRASASTKDYVRQVGEGLADLPLVVEFRNRAWVQEETFSLLTELNMGFCCVDEPRLKGLMPPVARATGPVAYLRLHGRNAAKWWRHEQAWERYDYTYNEDELREWVPKLRALNAAAPITLVYANNHYRGQSLDAINKLRKLLAGG